MKGTKILAIILAVVMTASVAAFVLTLPKDKPFEILPTEPTPNIYSHEASAYSQCASLSVKGSEGEIFMPTAIDGIFYTATLKNEIAFYEYNGGSFVPFSGEVKTVKTKISATYEKIPLTISYIEKDGKTYGCGVFTADMDSSVGVYGFAFAELINKPVGYGTGHLLLVDFNKDEFYKSDKTYSDFYNFNIAKGAASLYVSNNTRLVDENGSFRQDWSMLTDEFIANMGQQALFFSNRNYSDDIRMDIMILSNAVKPACAVKNTLGSWFVNDEHGMHFLRKTEKGFSNTVKVGDKESTLSDFEGDYFKDYLRCGNYLLNKKSLVITDLLVGSTKTLKDIDAKNATGFSISPDGARVVLAFAGENNSENALIQSVIYYDLSNDAAEPAIFCEPLLYSESCSFVWLNNNEVMSVRPLDDSGKTVGSVVYKF